MKRQFAVFLLRLLLNSFGLWLAVKLFGTGHDSTLALHNPGIFIVAGLIFSIVNVIVKPFVVILALPAILLTLGLFTVVVNGAMVWISLKLTPGLDMTFWNSILTGLVLSLINYIVSGLFEVSAGEGNK